MIEDETKRNETFLLSLERMSIDVVKKRQKDFDRFSSEILF